MIIKPVEIKVPEGVETTVAGVVLTVKGNKGSVTREFNNPQVRIEKKDHHLIVSAIKQSRREKTMIYTFGAHIKNMIKGVTQGHHYKLKVCAGHFPMNVSIANKQLQVKNYLGEKTPRVIALSDGVDVKIEGEFITVDGIDKERVAQAAANIEQLTKITNRDLRRFQDGIYLIHKDGKDL